MSCPAPQSTPAPSDTSRCGTGHVAAVWSAVTILAASAAIMIKYCHIPASSIGFWRVLGAAALLAPFWFRRWRHEGMPQPVSTGSALAGFFLGVHFATWCWAIQHTTIANAALFMGLQPLISPFIARAVIGERLNRGELAAVALAFCGMVWIVGGQVAVSPNDIAGTVVSFVSAILCAAYFVVSRKYRPREHILLYSTGVYLTAAAVQAVCAVCMDGRIALGGMETKLALAGLVLFPTIGGHTLAMYLLRHAKAQVMALSVPAQFVVSAMLAVPLFHEVPAWWFYPGALLISAGVVLGVWKAE